MHLPIFGWESDSYCKRALEPVGERRQSDAAPFVFAKRTERNVKR